MSSDGLRFASRLGRRRERRGEGPDDLRGAAVVDLRGWRRNRGRSRATSTFSQTRASASSFSFPDTSFTISASIICCQRVKALSRALKQRLLIVRGTPSAPCCDHLQRVRSKKEIRLSIRPRAGDVLMYPRKSPRVRESLKTRKDCNALPQLHQVRPQERVHHLRLSGEDDLNQLRVRGLENQTAGESSPALSPADSAPSSTIRTNRPPPQHLFGAAPGPARGASRPRPSRRGRLPNSFRMKASNSLEVHCVWNRNTTRADALTSSINLFNSVVLPIPGSATRVINPRKFSIPSAIESSASRCDALEYRNAGPG